MDAEQVRQIVLGLPEVEEYDHGGLPSFRVRGRRFASMLDREGVNLAPGVEAIRAAVAQWPQWCQEEWFGKRLAAVRVRFGSIDPESWRSWSPMPGPPRPPRRSSVPATSDQTGSTMRAGLDLLHELLDRRCLAGCVWDAGPAGPWLRARMARPRGGRLAAWPRCRWPRDRPHPGRSSGFRLGQCGAIR
jgi:hypothetical protein